MWNSINLDLYLVVDLAYVTVNHLKSICWTPKSETNYIFVHVWNSIHHNKVLHITCWINFALRIFFFFHYIIFSFLHSCYHPGVINENRYINLYRWKHHYKLPQQIFLMGKYKIFLSIFTDTFIGLIILVC